MENEVLIKSILGVKTWKVYEKCYRFLNKYHILWNKCKNTDAINLNW